MRVEAGESKLLLLETFSLFFFTRASSRGARAPKKDTSAFLMIFSYIYETEKYSNELWPSLKNKLIKSKFIHTKIGSRVMTFGVIYPIKISPVFSTIWTTLFWTRKFLLEQTICVPNFCPRISLTKFVIAYKFFGSKKIPFQRSSGCFRNFQMYLGVFQWSFMGFLTLLGMGCRTNA